MAKQGKTMHVMMAGLAVAAATWAMAAPAQAQTSGKSSIQLAQVFQDKVFQDLPPPRRRPRVRIYQQDERGVYPSYNPGPNAVRDCSATYVQEFRPSGTVITPRLNCYWRRG